MLHRDIKSPNLLMTDKNWLVVGDLGVAVPLEADDAADALPNARLYSPPEGWADESIDGQTSTKWALCFMN